MKIKCQLSSSFYTTDKGKLCNTEYKCLSANPQHAVSMAVLQHLDIRTLKLCADVKYVLHWLKYKSKRKLVIT